MSWLESLPNYTAYGTPSYFIYLLIAVLPMGISLYFGKRLAWYEAIVSFLFIFFMFDGSSAPQMLSLIGYVVYQTILVMGYFHYRQKECSGRLLPDDAAIAFTDHHRQVHTGNGRS